MSESIPIRPCAYCGTPTPINEDCSCFASELRRIGHDVEERSPNDSEAPMTEDHIPPALTRDEWNHGRAQRGGLTLMSCAAPRGSMISAGKGKDGFMLGPEDAPAIIAMLNDLLPDDSPYKITRDDLIGLASAASGCGGLTLDDARDAFDVFDNDDAVRAVRSDVVQRLQRLAEKLTALLPPE